MYVVSAVSVLDPYWFTRSALLSLLSTLGSDLLGNIAAPPLEVAAFYYHLLGNTASPIVSNASRAEMLHWAPLGSDSWSDGLLYGLGLMNYTSFGGIFLHIPNATVEMVGHGGADWGSQAMMSGYSEPFKVRKQRESNEKETRN
jgi:hypothetical protein